MKIFLEENDIRAAIAAYVTNLNLMQSPKNIEIVMRIDNAPNGGIKISAEVDNET